MNEIFTGDAAEVLRTLEAESIDLTVTSPPYDNLRKYNGYVFEAEPIIKELFRVTKIGGVVVWVIGDATVNGSETGTSFRQALKFMEVGFRLHDTMIYEKTNPIPLTHNRYEQCFEYMFVFSKEKPKTFNAITEKCKTAGLYTHRRKSGRVKENSLRARNESTMTKEEKIKTNIFSYSVGLKTDNGNHPAVFPEQLARDHILSWSNTGDTVLDPMCGSGTTLKMAKETGRNYIGIEISPEYVEIAKQRLGEKDGNV